MADPATAPETGKTSRKTWDRARLLDLGLEAASLSMLAFIATGLVVWSGRREISRELAQAWLRDHGVEAAVELDDVDATGFTGKIRLGARDNPVFAADRLEVAYDLSTPWTGEKFGIQTEAVRLVRPRVLASIDDKGQVRFGVLQPLIDDVLKSPKTPNIPGPAVLIEDARLDLVTPGGRVRLTGDASLDDGQLLRFDGRLAPLRYAMRDLAIDAGGATVSARKRGERLTLDVTMAIDSLEASSADLSDATAKLTADLPYPDLARMRANGPLEVRATLRAEDGRLADARGQTVSGEASLTGRLDGGLDSFAFLGRGRAAFRGGRFSTPSLDARDASLALDLPRVAGGRQDGRLTLRGTAGAELRASQAAAAGAALRALRARATADTLGLVADANGARVNGPLKVEADADRLAFGAMALASARLNASGRIDHGAKGLLLTLNGSVGGRSAISAPDAERLAALIPNPDYGPPLSQALQTFELSAPALGLELSGARAKLTLPREIRFSAPNGVTVAAAAPKGLLLDAGPDGARGALQASLQGGGLPTVRIAAGDWRAARGVVTSPLTIATEGFDLPPVKGVTGAIAGQARVAGGRFTLVMPDCAPMTAKAYALGDNPITAIKAKLCPAGAPLVTAAAGGWDAAFRFEDAEGQLAVAQARLQSVKGEATLGGVHGFERANVRVAGAAVVDTAAERRFNPVLAQGRLALSSGVWNGTFQAVTPVGAPLGEIRLRHVVATGAGQADIDASKLIFAKGGLQPADLSPMAAFATDAQGSASFTGVFAWTAQNATSRGRLVANSIDFTSPIGLVATLDGAIDFDSLAPLTTAPGQTLRIAKIDSIVPLTAVESEFQLAADSLKVSKATFEAAKGRISIEPINVPLGLDKTLSGTIVIEHLDLGEVIAASSLADKVKVQAIVDGRLPFTFGPEGLRFHEGELHAIQPGRVELNRTALTGVQASPADSPGAPAAPPAQVNAIQDFAYQAMENLAFDQLEAGVNSTDNGRLSVLFHIKGQHDPKVAEKARVGILDLLRGRAFDKRIALPAKTPVDLTLDTSLNFDELLNAWKLAFSKPAQPRSGAVQP